MGRQSALPVEISVDQSRSFRGYLECREGFEGGNRGECRKDSRWIVQDTPPQRGMSLEL